MEVAVTVTTVPALPDVVTEDDSEDVDSEDDDVWEAVEAPLVETPIGPFSVVMDAAAEVAEA